MQVAEKQTVLEITTEIYFKISGDTLNEVMIKGTQ
jgi:predicted regulator of Ras-like GTPase activity (Roadblock/LC7/MglB family)